jgi:hypothetical protein
MNSATARHLTVPQEIDLARRAIRGEEAYAEIGLQNTPASSPVNVSPYQHGVINVSSSGSAVLITGVTGQVIEVIEIMLYTDTSMDLELLDGSTSLTGPLLSWPAKQGFFFPFTGEPHFRLTAGRSFILTTSAAGQVSGFIRYRQG